MASTDRPEALGDVTEVEPFEPDGFDRLSQSVRDWDLPEPGSLTPTENTRGAVVPADGPDPVPTRGAVAWVHTHRATQWAAGDVRKTMKLEHAKTRRAQRRVARLRSRPLVQPIGRERRPACNRRVRGSRRGAGSRASPSDDPDPSDRPLAAASRPIGVAA